jgi:hypothetical protein
MPSFNLVPEEITILLSSDPSSGASNVSLKGDQFTVNLNEGIKIPSDALNVNVRAEESTVWWVVPNISADIGNNKFYVSEGGIPFVLTIPDGLYDLVELNSTLARLLENAGATTSPNPVIALSSDDASQKVILRLNYTNVSVDFTQLDTPRDILGFDSQIVGPNLSAPINIFADNTAQFNTIDYFLIHTDLIQKGISVNGNYTQTISTVLINTPPGSQIISSPRHPSVLDGQDLAGTNKTGFRVWLTDQANRPVDTRGEPFTVRLKISYLKPFIMA